MLTSALSIKTVENDFQRHKKAHEIPKINTLYQSIYGKYEFSSFLSLIFKSRFYCSYSITPAAISHTK